VDEDGEGARMKVDRGKTKRKDKLSVKDAYRLWSAAFLARARKTSNPVSP
jgi:hypothetical protein